MATTTSVRAHPTPYDEISDIPTLDPPTANPQFEDNEEIIIGSHRQVHPNFPLPAFRNENPDAPCPSACDGHHAQWFMQDLLRGNSPLGRLCTTDGQDIYEAIGRYAFHYGRYFRRMVRRERRVAMRLAQVAATVPHAAQDPVPPEANVQVPMQEVLPTQETVHN